MIEQHNERLELLRAWAAHDAETYRAFTAAATTLTGRPLRDLRVLDLGCGSNAPMTVMLKAAGCRVTGADSYVGHRWGLGFRPKRYIEYVREAGIVKTLRKIVGEWVYDRVYYKHLAALIGLSLTDSNLELRVTDIQHPGLPAGAFDVIHSNATWEHIADVRDANRTLARCLMPGGIAYIEIHLFPSLSGGHDLPWIVPGKTKLGDVRPWQHLRDPEWQPPVFLNRLRERDYREAFELTEGLVIEDWRVEFTEGEDLVSPDILQELSNYTPQELTTRSIIVIVRKKAASSPERCSGR